MPLLQAQAGELQHNTGSCLGSDICNRYFWIVVTVLLCECEIERIETLENESEFYMVWEPSSGRTMYRHTDEESAVAEAQRLCRQTDNAFYVLKAIQKVARPPKVVEVSKLVPPPQIEAKEESPSEDPFSDNFVPETLVME